MRYYIIIGIIFLIKSSLFAQVTYKKVFDPGGNILYSATNLYTDSSGAFLCTDYSSLYRFDSNGNLLSFKQLQGIVGSNYLIVQSNSMMLVNDVIISCPGGSTFAPSLIELDLNGNIINQISIHIGSNCEVKKSTGICSLNGNYFVAGSLLKSAPFVVCIDSTMNIKWCRDFSGIIGSAAFVKTDNSGNIIIGLNIQGVGPSVIKMDLDGNIIWSKKFDLNFYSEVEDFAVCNDGSYLLLGRMDTLYTQMDEVIYFC
jgi:hypothetical protein